VFSLYFQDRILFISDKGRHSFISGALLDMFVGQSYLRNLDVILDKSCNKTYYIKRYGRIYCLLSNGLKASMTYEGVSKSLRTESITK
jgi:hypothetical protein